MVWVVFWSLERRVIPGLRIETWGRPALAWFSLATRFFGSDPVALNALSVR